MRRCQSKKAYEEMSFNEFFYFKLWWPFCSVEQNHFSNFGKESPKEHFCEIILKSGDWSRSRCPLKVFLFFSCGRHFVQGNRTILAILLEDHPRNISVNYFEINPLAWEDISFKGFSIFSSVGHFVQRIGTILPVLVEGHPRNFAVKLFQNRAIGLPGYVIYRFFLF